MQYLRSLIARLRAWSVWHRVGLVRHPVQRTPLVVLMGRPILRQVTSTGVRVYSLCLDCGEPLSASATLCDACARKRSPSTPNF